MLVLSQAFIIAGKMYKTQHIYVKRLFLDKCIVTVNSAGIVNLLVYSIMGISSMGLCKNFDIFKNNKKLCNLLIRIICMLPVP